MPGVAVTVRCDDGARLAVHGAGGLDDHDRPLAVLQHGFPDTPATWRHLAPLLVDRGYRVAMPWLRGWAPSTLGTAPATTARLGADLRTLHAALGGDGRAVVAGHDWGAAGAYHAATDGPFAACVALAVPPEPALHGMLLDLDQLWRSRYMLRAQLPLGRSWCDEPLTRVVELWRRWSPGYEPCSADLAPLRAALACPGARRGMVAPYRAARTAALVGRSPAADGPVPRVPTLLVHGRDDGCIDRRYAVAAGTHLARGNPTSSVWLVPGGHWAHLEHPTEVGAGVTAFLDRTCGVAA